MQRLSIFFLIPFVLLFSFFNFSCLSSDDSEDYEDRCDEVNDLAGRTFEADLGEGSFIFPVRVSSCTVLFFAYQDGVVTIYQHPVAGYTPVDQFYSSPGGDGFAWTEEKLWEGSDQEGEFFQFAGDQWIDWTENSSWNDLKDIHFSSLGTGYFLLYSTQISTSLPKIYKFEDQSLKNIELPSGNWERGIVSSCASLFAAHLFDNTYPLSTTYVLRDGVLEEALVIDEWDEDFNFGGMSIMGNGEFWMWKQMRSSDMDYNPNPHIVSKYSNGAWESIYETDIEIKGVFSDSDDGKILWGDSGHLAIFNGSDWTETTFDTNENSRSIYYTAMDFDGNIWFAGIETWTRKKSSCLNVRFQKPLCARFADGEWNLMEIPDDIWQALVTSNDYNTCSGGDD